MNDGASAGGRNGPAVVQHLEGPTAVESTGSEIPPTGNTLFVLEESFESPAGVAEHWKQAQKTWQDLGPFLEWSARSKVYTLHCGTIVQALW